jgi:alkylation response protein AidB-like acyl-CoA dehydrogenase
MASGECIGAFAATEPRAGSDLMGVQCVARGEGGSLLLDGDKSYVSNGGFAEVFTVLARTPEFGRAKAHSLRCTPRSSAAKAPSIRATLRCSCTGRSGSSSQSGSRECLCPADLADQPAIRRALSLRGAVRAG